MGERLSEQRRALAGKAALVTGGARRIGRAARPVAAPAELRSAMKLAGRRPVELCTSQEVEKPCVVGFFRPRILVPGWLLAELSADELSQIVLHELEHLRRLDDLTNLLQKFLLALLPLHPGLFFIERQLCREREMACDEGVVRRTRAPRAYAACLASVAERTAPWSAPFSGRIHCLRAAGGNLYARQPAPVRRLFVCGRAGSRRFARQNTRAFAHARACLWQNCPQAASSDCRRARRPAAGRSSRQRACRVCSCRSQRPARPEGFGPHEPASA